MGNLIAIAGVIVTAFFNILLWRVSKKSADAADKSATVAQESLAFQKRQNDKEESEFNYMKRIYQARVRKDAEYLQAAVLGQFTKFNASTIQIAKQIPLPSAYELSRFFTEEQQHAIEYVWKKYLDYYSAYWFNGDTGEFNAKFSEDNPDNLKTISHTIGHEMKNELKKI